MINKAEAVMEAYRKGTPPAVGVIAIDGRSAAGKSTLASQLAALYGAAVVHMDDFFLPPELRTPQRFKTPGGNVHAERFAAEVLPFLRQGTSFGYRRFDCRVMDYAGEMTVPAAPLIVVEGAYACHPCFGKYADLTVFCDISPQEQQARILARNGQAGWQMFSERWIPLEEAYFAQYRTKENAMLVV